MFTNKEERHKQLEEQNVILFYLEIPKNEKFQKQLFKQGRKICIRSNTVSNSDEILPCSNFVFPRFVA